jgi:hypothetical protein
MRKGRWPLARVKHARSAARALGCDCSRSGPSGSTMRRLRSARSGAQRRKATDIRCWCCPASPWATPAPHFCAAFCARAALPPLVGGQGMNLGLRPGVLDRAHETMGTLRIEHGRAVSLVGWSLGGLYARELAKRSPEWCGLSSRWAPRSQAIRVRRTPGVSMNLQAAIASASTTSLAAEGRPARSDHVDLEPDRRRRLLALQRRDPTRPGGEYRRRLESSRPRGASCGALRDRRPIGPTGRSLGAVPSPRLARSRLFRSSENTSRACGRPPAERQLGVGLRSDGGCRELPLGVDNGRLRITRRRGVGSRPVTTPLLSA